MVNRDRLKEEELVLACQLGEPEAYRELVSLMEDRLSYYVRRFIPNEADALDVLQEVWLSVFRSIRKLRDPAAFRSWIYRIAHGIVVNRIRHELAQTKSEQIFADDFAEESVDPEWCAVDAALIHKMLARLSPPHREALTLYFLEDMSCEEISEAIGLSVGTVKSRLHYARKALRSLMEGAGYE